MSPQFAVASALAFLLSELADYAVHTPLREKNWLSAAAFSDLPPENWSSENESPHPIFTPAENVEVQGRLVTVLRSNP